MDFDSANLSQLLNKYCGALSFDVTEQQQALLIKYLAMMVKWNRAYNLTSVRNAEDMLVKHIVDSIAVKPFLDGQRFIDVGTGPGLPGIPLSIVMPQAHFVLLDSLGKRVRFMKQCAFELNLKNIEPVQSRVEAYTKGPAFDGVLSRAFASLKDMLHWCQHLVDSEGLFFALKGQFPETELGEIGDLFELAATHTVNVPGLLGDRHVVVVKKTA